VHYSPGLHTGRLGDKEAIMPKIRFCNPEWNLQAAEAAAVTCNICHNVGRTNERGTDTREQWLYDRQTEVAINLCIAKEQWQHTRWCDCTTWVYTKQQLPLEQSAAWRYLSSNADCFFGIASKLCFSPDHFLTNCFPFSSVRHVL